MSIAKYRTPLGTAIDEDYSTVLLIGSDVTNLLFKFYIYDEFAGIETQIGTITNIHNNGFDDSINLQILSTAWTENFSPFNQYSYYIRQIDLTGFKSDIYFGKFYLNEIGNPFIEQQAITIQNIISQVYALRNYAGASASKTVLTSNSEIDWSQGQSQVLTLVDGINTITFSNPLDGERMILQINQPADGNYGAISLPVNTHWLNSQVFVPTHGIGKYDVITLYYTAYNNIYNLSAANY